jgi:5'-nucleotidase
LQSLAKITVVAPYFNKSACSHSMTLTDPLRFKKYAKNCYYLKNGTPTDCIFLGLNSLYPKNKLPDLVISGINMGSNMGEDITYSGTVAGAMEAVLQGVPSIAISQVYNNLHKSKKQKWDFELANETIVKIVKNIFNDKFPLKKRKLLNINIPPISKKSCKGIKITKDGYRVFGNSFHKYQDPKGDNFHWIGTHPLLWKSDNKKNCDFEAIKNNYISITPIKLDMTSYKDINKLEKWLKEKNV